MAKNVPTRVIGGFGEKFVKNFLMARGYDELFSFQNASGHGIDIVGLKKGVIVYFEVKTSMSELPGRLSRAQRDSPSFVLKRLRQVARQEGRYRSVAIGDVRAARKLLSLHEKSGVPIGGVVVDVFEVNGWNVVGFDLRLQIRRWTRATAPRGKYRPR